MHGDERIDDRLDARVGEPRRERPRDRRREVLEQQELVRREEAMRGSHRNVWRELAVEARFTLVHPELGLALAHCGV